MRMRSSSRNMKAQNWVNYSACELLICEAVGVAKRPHVKSLRWICISRPVDADLVYTSTGQVALTILLENGGYYSNGYGGTFKVKINYQLW